MKKSVFAGISLWFLPALSFAQTYQQTGNDVNGLIATANSILSSIVPLLITLALIVFFWGLVQYILSSGEGDHKKGRAIMIAGIVSLFVMVSVWGIIRLAQNTLHVGGDQSITIPTVR